MAATKEEYCNTECVECGLTIDHEEFLYLTEERNRMKAQNRLSKRDMLNICVICWQETHSSPGDICDGLESCTDRFSELNEGKTLKVPGDIFVCHVCKNTFPDLNTLNIHERTHERMRKIICPWCKAVFPNGDVFGEHVKNNHTFESTSTFENITKHKAKKKRKKKRKESKSSKKYDNIWDSIQNTFDIPENPQRKAKEKLLMRLIKCDQCSFVAKSKKELKTHLKEIHVAEQKPKKKRKKHDIRRNDGLSELEDMQTGVENNPIEEHMLLYVNRGKEANCVPGSRDGVQEKATISYDSAKDFTECFLQSRRDDVTSECANDGDSFEISPEEDVTPRREEFASENLATDHDMDGIFRRPRDKIPRPLNRRFTIDKNKRLKLSIKR